MFDVAPEAYDRFMGRFSGPLADQFVATLEVTARQRALDVGCGTGALTARLALRLGPESVCAVDPSDSFVASVRRRLPGVDVRQGFAETLPYDPKSFDLTLAQLVVHFMRDPVAGFAEMARVTKPGGIVAGSVWDHAVGCGPLTPFWEAVRDVDADGPGQARIVGSREGELAQVFRDAGLGHLREELLTVDVEMSTFEQWWEPFTLGVGPAGAYVARLGATRRDVLRERCRALLPGAPFTVRASAWCVIATIDR